MRLAACILMLLSLRGQAAPDSGSTDWFRDAKYGIFMHFLPGDATGLIRVREFDVECLSRQLEILGAKYLVITLGQNSGFFNSPNAAYDRYTGYAPGERCSTRDLPLDLYRALKPRGIRLMLYLPCQTPNGDARAQKAFGLPEGKRDQPISLEFAQKWAQVVQEWSDRYGDKVAGWWFDGGYEHVRFNEEIAQVYAAAVKHGNQNAIVAFNPGVKLIRYTRAEDYTAGELNEPFDVLPASRWVEGSQWHALTYVGSHWSARDTRYPAEKWVKWVSTAVSNGGVVTLDMGPNWDPQSAPIGSLAEVQMEQVRAVRAALKAGPDQSDFDDREHPSRSAVELRARDGLPNFFAKAQAGGRVTVAYFGGSWRPVARVENYKHFLNGTCVIKDNYFAGARGLLVGKWTKATVTGNTLWSDQVLASVRPPEGLRFTNYTWDGNTYLITRQSPRFGVVRSTGDWESSIDYLDFETWRARTGFDSKSRVERSAGLRPTGTKVFVRPNRYDPGRAHVAVFNWDEKDAFEIDLSGVLLPGDVFRVHNVQTDIHEHPVVSGVFRDGTVRVPAFRSPIAPHFEAYLVVREPR